MVTEGNPAKRVSIRDHLAIYGNLLRVTVIAAALVAALYFAASYIKNKTGLEVLDPISMVYSLASIVKLKTNLPTIVFTAVYYVVGLFALIAISRYLGITLDSLVLDIRILLSIVSRETLKTPSRIMLELQKLTAPRKVPGKGIYCGGYRRLSKYYESKGKEGDPDEPLFGSISALTCIRSLEAEEAAVISKVMQKPLNILSVRLPARVVRTLPLYLTIAAIIGSVAGLYLVHNYGESGDPVKLLILMLMPPVVYLGSYSLVSRVASGSISLNKMRTKRSIEEELPYVTALTSALMYSGLPAAKIIGAAQRLRTLPEFRRISSLILRLQYLTGENILNIMEAIASVHPSQLFRIYLNTIVTVEKIGGEKFAAVAKLHEAFVENLRNRVKSFINTANMIMTISMMLFVLMPMIMVVALFIFSNVLGPESFTVLAAAMPVLFMFIVSALVTSTYVYEVSEQVKARVFLPSAIGISVLMFTILLPLVGTDFWLNNIMKHPLLIQVFQQLSYVTGIPYSGEYLANYTALIILLTATALLPLFVYSLQRYRTIELVIASLNQLVRGISEQVKLGIGPTQAVKKTIETGITRNIHQVARRFYEALYARLQYGIPLRSITIGLDEEVGFTLPRGISRLFEVLHFMENIGLEPRAVERFADMLVDVFNVREEVTRKVRSATYMGISFVILLALLIIVIKVSVIDSLEALREIAQAMKESSRALPLHISPISPEMKLKALILAYTSTILNALALGYIAGKTMSNTIATAGIVAAISVIIVSAIIFLAPYIQTVIQYIIPLPTLT